MKLRPVPISGAALLEIEPRGDDRGFFARTLCQRELKEHGLSGSFVQGNIAFTRRRGTLRGLHYQNAPYEEIKIVRCTTGAVYDVIADLRSSSATYGNWFGVELSASNRYSLYVPQGCAHGYQTLTDDAEVSYLVSEFYSPAHECGIRFDDPFFRIQWPHAEHRILSEKDRSWPLFGAATLDESKCHDHS